MRSTGVPPGGRMPEGERAVPPALLEYRGAIDNLDAIVVRALAERFRITAAVGRLKRELQMPPLDEEREAAQLASLRSQAADSGLDPAVVDLVFPAIMKEVRRRHRQG